MTALPIARKPHGPAASVQEGRTTSGSGRLARLLRWCLTVVTTTLFTLALAAFLAMAIGPRIFGYHTLTMLTGSMAPVINPGDVVVTQPVPASEIKVGDIITYHIPVEDQRVETHRVTQLAITPDGSLVVQTKGDANNGIDPWLATISAPTVDRHVFTIRYVGQAILAIREPIVLNTLMYGAPAILVIGMLKSIWRREPSDKKHEQAQAGPRNA